MSGTIFHGAGEERTVQLLKRKVHQASSLRSSLLKMADLIVHMTQPQTSARMHVRQS